MLTPELETAIRNSLEDATRRGHEFAALEHLLLALLGLIIEVRGNDLVGQALQYKAQHPQLPLIEKWSGV